MADLYVSHNCDELWSAYQELHTDSAVRVRGPLTFAEEANAHCDRLNDDIQKTKRLKIVVAFLWPQ